MTGGREIRGTVLLVCLAYLVAGIVPLVCFKLSKSRDRPPNLLVCA